VAPAVSGEGYNARILLIRGACRLWWIITDPLALIEPVPPARVPAELPFLAEIVLAVKAVDLLLEL
jgi:hypothetical protein